MPACSFSIASAKQPLIGPDSSGIYDCTGQDDHEEAYKGTVTLERVPAQSVHRYGAYSFKLKVPGFGTGIASFRKNRQGRWTFKKYYDEPEFKGGNHGTEACIRRSAVG